MNYSKEFINEFWSKVDVKSITDCWNWQGVKDKDGYGIFKSKRAHRLSVMFENKDPTGLFVCHHCDNPPCVNPNHLYIGTAADNNRDIVTRGRAKGRPPSYGNSKLSHNDVLDIREYGTTPARIKELAELYKVTVGSIKDVIAYKTHTHIK